MWRYPKFVAKLDLDPERSRLHPEIGCGVMWVRYDQTLKLNIYQQEKVLNYSDLKSWRPGAASLCEMLRSTKLNKMAIMRFELRMGLITSSLWAAVPG